VEESFPEVLMPLLAAYHGGEKLVLLFDYDGTLTPLAEYPWLARLAPRTRDVLARLAAVPRVWVGVLSGRRLDELEQLIGHPGLIYGGLSGIELKLKDVTAVHPAAAQAVPLIEEVTRRLAAIEHVYPGAWVEHKNYGFTVHFRGVAPSLVDEVHARILGFLERWARELRVVDGPLAVEVTVAGTWHKGDNVAQIVAQIGEPAFLFYAGATANDREAFDAVTAHGGITVGVGPDAPSRAAVHASDPELLTDWLDALALSLEAAVVET
jgi:trehalose-phosphatase